MSKKSITFAPLKRLYHEKSILFITPFDECALVRDSGTNARELLRCYQRKERRGAERNVENGYSRPYRYSLRQWNELILGGVLLCRSGRKRLLHGYVL